MTAWDDLPWYDRNARMFWVRCRIRNAIGCWDAATRYWTWPPGVAIKGAALRYVLFGPLRDEPP